MLKNTTKQAVLNWFTGRARDNAEHALGLLGYVLTGLVYHG